jgi:deazaflavin-dependent oxidoreductase (nitroreductase family)
MAAKYRRGLGPTRMVLLLTTTWRKSGLQRLTPLQFVEIHGDFYIASARGQAADWFKNLLAAPISAAPVIPHPIASIKIRTSRIPTSGINLSNTGRLTS